MAQRTLEVSSRCNLPCNPMGDKQDHCYSNATSKETQERQIPFSELVHPHWFSRLAKSDFEWVAVTTKTTVRVRGRGPITIEGRATAVTEAVALLQRRVERWGSQGDITSGKALQLSGTDAQRTQGLQERGSDLCFLCQLLTSAVAKLCQ